MYVCMYVCMLDVSCLIKLWLELASLIALSLVQHSFPPCNHGGVESAQNNEATEDEGCSHEGHEGEGSRSCQGPRLL